MDALGTWWRQYGQPVPGPERRLANGVAWRLHVDRLSGIAQPRITWMPDPDALRRANALHACEAVVTGNLAHFWQVTGSVTLTCASARLASSIEVISDRAEERDKELPAPGGHIFDLAHHEDVGPGPCDQTGGLGTLDRPFQLRGFLDTCAASAHERFLALWRRALEITMQRPSYRRDTSGDDGPCSIDFDARDTHDLLFGLHLTPAGLAVRIVRMWPRGARYSCTRANSPYDTVVLPWHDLEPFLKPGPWRADTRPVIAVKGCSAHAIGTSTSVARSTGACR